jgi:N-acetylmuramoyl-L-alanine amidase
MVEQGTHNPLVVGSNPTGPTRKDDMRRTKTATPSEEETADLRARASKPRIRVSPVILVVVAVVLVFAGFALGRVALSALSGRVIPVGSAEVEVGGVQPGQAGTGASAVAAPIGAGMVEVPQLVGVRADEAVVVLETAGFRVRVLEAGTAVAQPGRRLVLSQTPAAATVLSVDSTVTIVAPPGAADTTSATVASVVKSRKPKAVVCIDPGHQAHSDTKLEPVGPEAKSEKPRATGGATGVATAVPEHEIALQVSMNLKKRLEDAGFKVVMTRTTNDVRLSNAQRASIANRAKADLFVRIHCGVSTNPSDSGVSTYYPVKNHWTSRILKRSRSAAKSIDAALTSATGASGHGAQTQAGIAGFNWSKVPSVFVEVGYLSNPVEDKLLSSPNHQDKVADGLAQGIIAFESAEGR